MEKDALNQTKKKSTETHSETVGASPLIFILAIFAIIIIGLYFFKDKIFKNKSKNLDELVKEQKSNDDSTKPEQETVSTEEAEKINDKFAKQ